MVPLAARFPEKTKGKAAEMNREMNGKGVRNGSGIVALLGTFCMDQIGHGGGEAEGNWIILKKIWTSEIDKSQQLGAGLSQI